MILLKEEERPGVDRRQRIKLQPDFGYDARRRLAAAQRLGEVRVIGIVATWAAASIVTVFIRWVVIMSPEVAGAMPCPPD